MLCLYFVGFDDLMLVVGGVVWVFYNVILVVKLFIVIVLIKFNLFFKKCIIKIVIYKVLGNIKKCVVFFFKLV